MARSAAERSAAQRSAAQRSAAQRSAAQRSAAQRSAAAWSALHHGLDPDGVALLRPWLRLMWLLARPLARLPVPPLAVTVLGVVLAMDAALFAARLPWIALGLVVLSVVCDGVDGAVAVLTSGASAFGAVADKVADRLADCAFAVVLWRCGAPWWLALVAGGLSLAHEGVRVVLGGTRLALLTVAERPTRAICAVLACGCAGVSSVTWPPTVCASVWVGLAVIGLGQILRG